MLVALLVPLGLAILFFILFLIRAAVAQGALPKLEAVVLGGVVSFFDTLGIGSFAPSTAWMKFRRMVPDKLIPPTLVVGLGPPAMAESIIFLILLGVKVDPVLLFGSAVAVLLGGLIGAPLVTRARVSTVQLVVAGGGTAAALPMGLTVAAIVASFGFGILLNFGVGNYAPTLVILSLMGMDPRLCFPIMASGAALMSAGAGIRHIQIGRIDLRVVIGLAIGGIPAVLVAAFIVKSMPVEMLRWLVIVVVLYAAFVMLRAAHAGRKGEMLTPEEVVATS